MLILLRGAQRVWVGGKWGPGANVYWQFFDYPQQK